VIGGASPNSSASSGTIGANTGSSSGSSYSSVQASALSSISKSDLWGEVEDSLRTSLGCLIPKNAAQRASGSPQSSSLSSSSSASASRADVTFSGDSQSSERQRGVDGCTDGRAISINQMSGTILVRGMPNEHRIIAKMLHSMQLNIERQVIIEAKIIDVQLNKASQQGINWAAFNNSAQHNFSVGANTSAINSTANGATLGGSLIAGTTLGGLFSGNTTTSGLSMAAQNNNFMAMISFMETQGNVHVLSSPRIATLNNQKAVIKVGSEEPFVTNASGGSIVAATTTSPATISNPTITYQPFFSGIALDVTPQIDDKGNITLHVHSMVNSITMKDKLAIIGTAGDRTLPFAVNSINETDNVVKTTDGQVVVIGGLMTESVVDTRSKIPGMGEIPLLGALFSNGAQSKIKRELVILLKPTVVKSDSTWTDDIAATENRIENFRPGKQTQTKGQ
jgi:MSHA biogenesis protein MshL